jgi:hypothetical protein
MKHILIFSWIFLLSHLAYGQDTKQIKSRDISVVCTRTEQLQKGKKEISIEVTHYDRKGRETTIEYFNADSICIATEQFSYNRKGRTIRHSTVDSLEMKSTIIEQEYDRWNRLTQKASYENNTLAERTEYAYNNFDDRISEMVYDKDGKLKKKSEFAYDSKGMLIRKTTTNAEGIITYEKIVSYDY